MDKVMQFTMNRTISVVGKIAFTILALFLAVLSLNSKWRYASIVAIALLATNFLDGALLKRLFRLPRWVINAIGTLVWLIVALVEVYPAAGA
jgi:hypothetical protein